MAVPGSGGIMAAPQGNQNAAKEETGLSISFYLSGVDVAYIRRHLKAQLGREPSKKEIRKLARVEAKNGIWGAIKGEIPAIIV
jgi:hypothetical protein